MKQYGLLLLLTLGICISSCKQTKDSNSAIQDVPQENNYSQEIRLKALNDAVKEHPEDPTLYYQRGMYLLELKRGQEAYQDAEYGLKFDNSNCSLWLLKAKAIITIPNLTKSVQAAKKAEQLGCKNAELFSFFAELYYISKEYDKAMMYVNQAIELDKFDAHSYLYRGLIYKSRNDTSLAVSNFQTAIELKPEDVDSYNELAMIYYDRQDYNRGFQYLNSGLRFAPKDAFLNYNIGMYYFYKMLPDSAVTWYERAVFFEPNMFQAHYMLGKLAFDKRNYDAALKYFETGKKYNDQDVMLNYYLAMTCEYRNRLEEALSSYAIVASSMNKYQESAARRIAVLNSRGAVLRPDSVDSK